MLPCLENDPDTWFADTPVSAAGVADSMKVQKLMGVPYTDEMIASASADAAGQANPLTSAADGVTERYGDATAVRTFDGRPDRVTEMDALVAYLQILGKLTDLPAQIQPVAEE